MEEIFEEFDSEPVASGSVAQVYKAKYDGKAVAVKVRELPLFMLVSPLCHARVGLRDRPYQE